jgi:hypothetical protein
LSIGPYKTDDDARRRMRKRSRGRGRRIRIGGAAGGDEGGGDGDGEEEKIVTMIMKRRRKNNRSLSTMFSIVACNNWQSIRVRVRVTLRLAVYSQSVRLGAKPLEIHDQRFFFVTEPLQ